MHMFLISQMRSQAYDLVMAGVEVGGGSVRIHDSDMQVEVLKVREIIMKFIKGFQQEALVYK